MQCAVASFAAFSLSHSTRNTELNFNDYNPNLRKCCLQQQRTYQTFRPCPNCVHVFKCASSGRLDPSAISVQQKLWTPSTSSVDVVCILLTACCAGTSQKFITVKWRKTLNVQNASGNSKDILLSNRPSILLPTRFIRKNTEQRFKSKNFLPSK